VLQVGCVEHEVERGKHGCDMQHYCDKAPPSDGRPASVGDAQEQEQERNGEATGEEGEQAALAARSRRGVSRFGA
jgi:hypothetical protein